MQKGATQVRSLTDTSEVGPQRTGGSEARTPLSELVH